MKRRSQIMRRHDLLHVEMGVWENMLRDNVALRSVPHIAGWASHGWPVIVRRWSPNERPVGVPVAVPLPPIHGTQRVSMAFGSDQGLTPAAAVTLRAARSVLPLSWQTSINELLNFAEQNGHAPRVFGSALWQYSTLLPYLSPRSDLDLLWSIADQESAAELIAALTRIDARRALRLDGEMVLPSGRAVNWREWARAADLPSATVLVKTLHGLEMLATSKLFDIAEVGL